MTDQKIKICLKDSDGHELGIMSLKSNHYSAESCPTKSFGEIKLFNVPELIGNKVPIQFKMNPRKESANIVLLEETQYTLFFKSKSDISDINFPTLQRYEKDFDFSKISIEKNFFVGTLNTGSYVGKSFFDVEINKIKSLKIPFEVRSKKINYDEHYPIMISDLCEAASGIVFDTSPVFEPQKLKEIVRKTFYEDFIFFEYLFRPENLISAYEYIRRDPHKILERYDDQVPLTLAQFVGPSDMLKMVSDSANLYKTAKIPFYWPEIMDNHLPYQVNQTFYKDILDTPENRLVKFFLQLIHDFLNEMVTYINEKKIEGYATDKIHEFQHIIQDYILDSWLDDVGNLTYFPSNSQVLQKREGYRDILKFFMVLESSFFLSIEELKDQIEGYQRKLYDLYEDWCYIKLFKIISEMSLTDLDYNRIFDKTDTKEWSVRLKRGEKYKQCFDIKNREKIFKVELLYNRTFSQKSKFRSYSLNLRPDYTLIIKYMNTTHLIHFDAKYRSDILFNNSDVEKRDKEEEEQRIYKNADVYKMHTYKDAIKNSLGAYVLYPGHIPEIFEENPDTIVPSVGAFPLTPGEDLKETGKIDGFIKDVLDYICLTDSE